MENEGGDADESRRRAHRLRGEGGRLVEGVLDFEVLHRGLEENPLPPFATLRKYFAPSGAIMTVDATGFHYTGFGLKRK